jgi:transcriptional regulator with XRE-family HTH domain/Zn-dependent peptidase ImmA (M78 family)
MNSQLINIIFGMKVKQGRTEAGLTVSEFAAQCNLSPSYVTEIEKGRKYPRADKIMSIAQVLGRSYDDLVSIRLEPPLTHLGTALSSPIIGQFPFEEFGIEMSDLMGMLTREPGKASALLHAISEVGRQYDMQEQHFLRAALRSYQELHDNYFPDLEDAAATFAQQHKLGEVLPVPTSRLQEVLEQEYKFDIDYEHLSQNSLLTGYRSVYLKGARPKLLINTLLQPHQIKFALARELGYQYLGLTNRAMTSSPDQVTSFQQVFNDFKASYFAGTVLMPGQRILDDIQAYFDLTTWSTQPLLDMLDKYDVSPESLLYRFSELVPQFFGVKLHYLRVHSGTNNRYELVKQLNLNRLRVPNGLAVDEHFCRRWLVVRLLRELNEKQVAGLLSNGRGFNNKAPVVGVQMSEYLDTNAHFLCFGFARPLSLTPNTNSCGIIGFRRENGLASVIKFASDLSVPQVTINETCERCSLTAAQCQLRAVPPTVREEKETQRARKQALRQLIAQIRE